MEMNKKLLLIGGGGHCKVILDSLLLDNQYAEVGIIDLPDNIGKYILNIPILGSDDDLEMLYQEGYHYAFLTIGSIGNPEKRIKLYKALEQIGFIIPNIIDPTAIVSNYSQLDHGIYIGKQTIVNPGTIIGKGAIINTSSVIEHDCTIDEFVHISPGTILCGEVSIGRNTHIGAGCMIRQQIKIGRDCIIGMGSVVLQNMKDTIMAYGNPCREVKQL